MILKLRGKSPEHLLEMGDRRLVGSSGETSCRLYWWESDLFGLEVAGSQCQERILWSLLMISLIMEIGRLVVPWNNTFVEGKIKVCVLQHIQPSMVGLKGNFALARCLANDCSDKACP